VTRPEPCAALVGAPPRDALRRQMLFAHDALESYRDSFRRCGIARRDIAAADPMSLLRRLPALKGERFRDLVDETIRVAGDIVDIEVSSGTTGTPKRRIMTRSDADAETEVLARLLAVPGIGPGDSVACLDTGPLTLMVSFIEALDRLGVDESWAFSAYLDERATVEGLLALDPTVVITIPSILDRIIEPLSAGLRREPRRLRKIVYVGEKMRESTRRSLESGLGLEVFAYYGASETSALGIECRAHKGIHILTEWNIVEIAGGGCEGEALVTTLDREGLPLLRYALGDILRVRDGACPCGLDFPRVDVLGRTDAAVSVLGVKLTYDTVRQAALWPVEYAGPIGVELSGNGRDRMSVALPGSLAAHEPAIVGSMRTREPDLAYLISSGFLELDVSFVDEKRLESRKTPRILDRRHSHA
jgi:phenylacetate-CoA ligase